jgi:hypothetical protein
MPPLCEAIQAFTHQALLECLEALLLRKYKGQPLLPMWLPEYPPSDLPRLTSTEIPSPPIAPTSFSVTVTEKMIRPPRRPGFFNSFGMISFGPAD